MLKNKHLPLNYLIDFFLICFLRNEYNQNSTKAIAFTITTVAPVGVSRQ